jgi:hypothetical protein
MSAYPALFKSGQYFSRIGQAYLFLAGENPGQPFSYPAV